MLLNRDAYRALEDIVGSENISDDVAVIDSYCRSWGEEYLVGQGFKWMPRFAAIVLPGDTKEVQSIIKTCSRLKIRFKAHSTGYSPLMCSLKEGCLCLDLRRMNRILEINEKGMYVVVEPYVIGAVLQAELMKRGLATGMIDPGAMTTALPIVPVHGVGNIENTYANTHRNQLALEWVLPTGEILRTGSLGSGAGWFCSEGPGPSLRGIACGNVAIAGGLGIFTKAAIKVYHWPGPTVLPVEGVSPNYRLKPEQKWFGFWFFSVPSYEKAANAGNKIGQSEIAIVLQRSMAWRIAADSARSMEEAWGNLRKTYSQIEGKGRVGGWIVLIGADTEKEFKYKEKTLMQIIKDVDGELLPFLEDDLDAKLRFISRWTRTSTCDRETRRAGGGRISAFITFDSIDLQMNVARVSTELKREYIKAGRMVDDGGDQGMGNFGEHGREGHVEQIAMAHYTAEGTETLRDFGRRSMEMMLDPGYRIIGNFCEWGPHFTDRKLREEVGSRYVHNEHLWNRKIKKTFDPENLSDATFYSPE